MQRRPTSTRWKRWLQGAGWTLTLVALAVATVGVAASTAMHAGTVTLLPPAAEKHPAGGETDKISALPDWGWEWQPDLDPGSIASPAYLR
jgi:hypothetical protein